jgi:uncharacterized membrane protein
MITFKDRITIDRPIEQVFAFVANLENIPKYQSEVVKSEVITEGPIRLGSKFTEVVNILGRKVNAVCEVTEYEHLKELGFKSTSSPTIEYGGHFVFNSAQDGAGTQITFTGTASLKGLWRLVEPLFAGELRKGITDELMKLKNILEAQPAPSAVGHLRASDFAS